MKIIDGTNLIVGRLGTRVAKMALLGEEVAIINCDKVIISGKRSMVMAQIKRRRSMGTWAHGPHFPRTSERIVKRMIRGMLPYKESKGEVAFKRIKCYTGVPTQFKDAKAETFPEADCSKLPHTKYVTILDVVKFLGGSH
jgi:large subunit ribosomal protein L13